MKKIFILIILSLACQAVSMAQKPREKKPDILESIDSIRAQAARLAEKSAKYDIIAPKYESSKEEIENLNYSIALAALASPYNESIVAYAINSFNSLDNEEYASFKAENAGMLQALKDYKPMLAELQAFLKDVDSGDKENLLYYQHLKQNYYPKFEELAYYKKYYKQPTTIPYLEALFKAVDKEFANNGANNHADFSNIIILANGIPISLK